MKPFFAIALLLAVTPAFAAPAAKTAPAETGAIPSGAYRLDKSHASLLFSVNHLGFSHWTARFGRFDATLRFDRGQPAASRVEATVDATSLDVDGAPAGFLDELKGPQWLDAGAHPQMRFVTRGVTVTGPNTARIAGDFTMGGVTKPLTLNATYNGGYAGHPMDPNARIGFSATGVLKRSQYGVSYGIPAPGTTLGVSDDVRIVIEAEFSGPPLAGAARP